MVRLSIFLAIVGILTACSQSNSSSAPGSNDLTQLENDWMHAMMKRDQTTLDKLVAPEFTVTSTKYIDSNAVPRSMWMYNTMNDFKVDSVHFIKTKVTIVDNVGIVRALFFWSGTYDNVAFSDSVSFVDTWISRNGDWRVISRVMSDTE
jgi:hypothetical protein